MVYFYFSLNNINFNFSLYRLIRLDELDKLGMTPLMYATRSHKIDMVRYLLQKGADKNKKCKYGRDVMYFSRNKQGRIPIAVLIVINNYY
jgi:ankyrin repeat protein